MHTSGCPLLGKLFPRSLGEGCNSSALGMVAVRRRFSTTVPRLPPPSCVRERCVQHAVLTQPSIHHWCNVRNSAAGSGRKVQLTWRFASFPNPFSVKVFSLSLVCQMGEWLGCVSSSSVFSGFWDLGSAPSVKYQSILQCHCRSSSAFLLLHSLSSAVRS